MRTLKLGNTNIYPITYAHYVYLADGVTTVSAQLSSLTTALNNLSLQNSQRIQDIADINALVPTQATTSNKLADKDFVNSSISTNTANFIGTFVSVSALNDYAGTLTNNDYAFVRNRVLPTDYSTIEVLNAISKTNLTHFDYAYVVNDTKFDLYRFNIVNQTWELKVQNTTKLSADSLNIAFNRYKFNGTAWVFEYTLNNSSFTAAQWNAINSGITGGLVNKIGNTTLTTTAQNLSDAVNEIKAAIVEELFECTYGTTTYAEITAALSAGKIPYFFYNNRCYYYHFTRNDGLYFFGSWDATLLKNYYIYIQSNNGWSMGNKDAEDVSNKVISLSSSSTDIQYPSAKCVYDIIGNIISLMEDL